MNRTLRKRKFDVLRSRLHEFTLSTYTYTFIKRLEARVTPEQKDIFLKAARLQGRTLTDFVLTSLQDTATRIIKDYELMRLTAEDSRTFVNAILHPPNPSQRLREAIFRSENSDG